MSDNVYSTICPGCNFGADYISVRMTPKNDFRNHHLPMPENFAGSG